MLTPQESFDFETKPFYAIRSVPQTRGMTFDKDFTVTVTDIPENNAPTDITLSNATIAENQTASTLVGTISGTDPDPGNTLTFSLATSAQKPDNAALFRHWNPIVSRGIV